MIWKLLLLTIAANIISKFVNGEVDSCPSEPCSPPSKLKSSDTLTISLYWDQFESERTSPIYENICSLIENVGDQIKIQLRPGAMVTVNEQNQIQCGDFCEADRKQSCFGKLNKKYFTSCIDGNADISMNDVRKCVKNKEADQTLIDNGKDRVEKKIPDCYVPAVTFNDQFDLCAKYDKYEDLLNYVCDLYDQALNVCSS